MNIFIHKFSTSDVQYRCVYVCLYLSTYKLESEPNSVIIYLFIKSILNKVYLFLFGGLVTSSFLQSFLRKIDFIYIYIYTCM